MKFGMEIAASTPITQGMAHTATIRPTTAPLPPPFPRTSLRRIPSGPGPTRTTQVPAARSWSARRSWRKTVAPSASPKRTPA